MDTGGTLKNERQPDFRPKILHVCILFSAVIILLLLVGVRVQSKEFYTGVLVTEFGLMVLPAFLMLLFYKYDFKKVLRLNKVRPLALVLIFFIMLIAVPLAGVFNFINLWVVNQVFGKIVVTQPPISTEAAGLAVNILVIGGLAGICEEFLFRGVIQRGLERIGPAKAILTAAFLFSLTHMDFHKILGTFFLGALIGFLVYRSNSLYSGIFAHFTNNAAVVVYTYAGARIAEQVGESVSGAGGSQTDVSELFSALSSMPEVQLIIIAVFYGVVLLILLAIFFGLLVAFVKATDKYAEKENVEFKEDIDLIKDEAMAVAAFDGMEGNKGIEVNKEETAALAKERKSGLLWLLPGILLIFIVYYAQMLSLKGVTNGLVEWIIKVLLGK